MTVADHSFPKALQTPAFVYDETQLNNTAERIRRLTKEAGCQFLYSLKACGVPGLLNVLARHVDGLACSSLYEGKLARQTCPRHPRHLTTPGLRPDDIDLIADLFDVVAFNSLGQWHDLGPKLSGHAKRGLRVNPQLSFAGDRRYDPCRRNSKLGVKLNEIAKSCLVDPTALNGLDGLHVHNNCDSTDARALRKTVDTLSEAIPHLMEQVRWINLGGGYLLDELENPEVFIQTIKGIKTDFDVEVFVEPGAALVRQAGSIHSRVVDLFNGDDVRIAVLDASVNHMPEVLEYEYVPDVLGHVEGSAYRYLLTGATCLAGDQFGVSHFDRPLEIGSLVIFPNAGAYTFSRANMFNGLPLPHIYRRTAAGELILEREATFDDFAGRMGVNRHVRA